MDMHPQRPEVQVNCVPKASALDSSGGGSVCSRYEAEPEQRIKGQRFSFWEVMNTCPLPVLVQTLLHLAACVLSLSFVSPFWLW